ncbi:hypothetical protein ACFV6F_06975 [Kitasatospora phosalacinea]|uniref:hypothetical protein n=1 Tax=Kitasatospora phosalacinea TaxID=2065 RepID=UPI0036513418
MRAPVTGAAGSTGRPTARRPSRDGPGRQPTRSDTDRTVAARRPARRSPARSPLVETSP